ncbi:methyltransferase type 12 [Mycobacterium triplex]|uniref:Methyltransferase type 12 n=1 Tax=Mycobacterium triplex TaxID=47839 RepID=A0A024K1M7_9MYCO|nr:class I SAM-dependent methyltransferase [Mycobacterium triplex]ORX01505.1 methyltransferase type 12 [Mycobacterium triplex]CDO89694.1 O-methyltransferase [Mycobacterium triplex]
MDSSPAESARAPLLLRESIVAQLLDAAAVGDVAAKVDLPAVPDLIDEYLIVCGRLCAELGRELSGEERARVRRRLGRRLAEAHTASTRSIVRVVVAAFRGRPVQSQITAHPQTLQRYYARWLHRPGPSLFGKQADARVWTLAREAADPTTHPVLDIGAGIGRNALALARRGHPVDAVELTHEFADVIRSEAAAQSVDVRVVVGDVFAAVDELRRDYQLILLSEVVSDFVSTEQLRGLFELAGRCLAPGALMVFNTFLAAPEHALDQATREFGQHFHTGVFTRGEIDTAAIGLPFELIADDAVYSYEKTHLPPGAWPPTRWYPDWIRGVNAFPIVRDMSPIEMRWLVYQKFTSS